MLDSTPFRVFIYLISHHQMPRIYLFIACSAVWPLGYLFIPVLYFLAVLIHLYSESSWPGILVIAIFLYFHISCPPRNMYFLFSPEASIRYFHLPSLLYSSFPRVSANLSIYYLSACTIKSGYLFISPWLIINRTSTGNQLKINRK